MTFAAPLLLAGLALLVPVLVAFLVRRRHVMRTVPSVLLWRIASVSRARSRRIRTLTRLLALALCLVGVAALVLAAARPAGLTHGETVAIVVDVSASMEAGSFEEARSVVARMLAIRGAGDQIALIAAGPRPVRLAGPTSDGAALDEGLDRLRLVPGGADLGAAIDLASSLVAGARGARIVLVSDGGLAAGDPSWERRGVPIGERRILPSSRDNVGIVGFATRPSRDSAGDDREALVSVATSSARPRRVVVAVSANGKDLARRRVDLPARGRSELRVRLRVAARRLTATVTPADGVADAISLDDEASLTPGRSVPGRAILVTKGTEAEGPSAFFAEQALRAAGVREVVRVAPDRAVQIVRSDDVVVVLSEAPDRRADTPTLYLGTTAGALPVQIAKVLDGSAGETRLRSIETRDAVTRGVELEGVTIERAVAVDPPSGARALVDLDGGTVVSSGGAGRGSWVYIGIDPARSDLVLRVAFPVLVASALQSLGGASSVAVAPTVPASETSMREGQVTAVPLPEVSWKVPVAPAALLGILGILLLAAEGLAWRKGLVS
ncbi:MAG: VWA domain-containing protein [Deltaproteobacteria bacterium]|nr:VWA domain-containing protein [Deltaproteobacteria bacterium]